MNVSVTPAVTTPSATQASRPDRLNADGRGRTRTRSRTPAQARRSQAAPSGRMRSNSPTDAARPSWTQSIDATASDAPERALVGTPTTEFTRPVNPSRSFASTSPFWTYRSASLDNATVETRRLRLLLELARLGSMRAVADELHTTTSAVSQQLAVLAREAGTALVEPAGRRVRLTPAGRRLAEHAATILAAVDAARRDLDPAVEPAGTVRVAGFATAVRRSLLPAVADLADRHPRVRLLIGEHEPAEAIAAARGRRRRHRAHLRLQPGAGPRRPEPRRHPALVRGLEPGGPRRGPAGDRPGDAPALIARYRAHDWIVNSRNTADEDVARTLASLAGSTLRITHRADSLDLVQDLITAGLGVALLPADQPVRAGVRLLALTGPEVLMRAYALTRRGSGNWAPLALVVGLLTAGAAVGR